jgi:hypothetical protein
MLTGAAKRERLTGKWAVAASAGIEERGEVLPPDKHGYKRRCEAAGPRLTAGTGGVRRFARTKVTRRSTRSRELAPEVKTGKEAAYRERNMSRTSNRYYVLK